MKHKYLANGYGSILLLAVVVVICFFFVPGFDSPGMYFNVLTQAATSGTMALGMLFVLICGDIDLSINAQYAMYGSLCAYFIKMMQISTPIAVALTLLCAVVIGSVLGWVIDTRGLNSMIATIAAGVVLSGLTYIMMNGLPIFNIPPELEHIVTYRVLGFSMVELQFLLMAVLASLILRCTYWGKFFHAIGYNIDASRKSGVPVRRSRMLAFALCSLFCAIAAINFMSRIGLASPSSSENTVEDVLTILALAGVSFSGGYGRVLPVTCAALLLTILTTASVALRVPLYYQTVIKGAILFVAISTKMNKS